MLHNLLTHTISSSVIVFLVFTSRVNRHILDNSEWYVFYLFFYYIFNNFFDFSTFLSMIYLCRFNYCFFDFLVIFDDFNYFGCCWRRRRWRRRRRWLHVGNWYFLFQIIPYIHHTTVNFLIVGFARNGHPRKQKLSN